VRLAPLRRACTEIPWHTAAIQRASTSVSIPANSPSAAAASNRSASRRTVASRNLARPDANPDEGEFAESLKQVTAQGRYGHTSDVAAVVSFLAGPESGYVTGANWNVDGGFTV
jgi:NAD(P)-dependent dehydrogenase (short-subunit alcohol dehydrogenase family)